MKSCLLFTPRNPTVAWPIFLASIIVLTMNGCLSYPQAKLATAEMNHRAQEAASPYRYQMSTTGDSISISRVPIKEARENQAPYRLVAEQFVRYAQTKNLSGMMRMTDPNIIKMSGSERVRTAYLSKVITDFETGPVTWEPPSWFGPDDMNHPTHEFVGRIGGKKTFYLYVINESGRLVVCIYSHRVTFGRNTIVRRNSISQALRPFINRHAT